MTREEFQHFCETKYVILDGATGSILQKRGMPVGVCPEEWILKNPEVLIGLQMEYLEAGTDILYAPTFSGNRIKLEEYGLSDRLEEMNRSLLRLSKKAVLRAKQKGMKRPVYVAGDLTMTGQQLYPIGTLTFEELVDIYKEQIKAMLSEGVDLFVVETMMSLQECRAAVLAVKETCDLPVMVTLTFNEDGRTFYGTDPQTAIVVLEKLGADAVGANCSTGPDKMEELLKIMIKNAAVPVIAKPNAGLPVLKDGETTYDMGPDQFAEEMVKRIRDGVRIAGGCCGTTPEHIKRLCEMIEQAHIPAAPAKKEVCLRMLTTERMTQEIDLDGPFFIVGERINPTGKKALQKELREGCLDLVDEMALSQVEAGAKILDINVGMNGINEKETMVSVVTEMTMAVNVPLCIDSSYVDVIEAALRIYPGRALINSISMESEKMKRLIPIAKKYGAMFILLPLSDEGLPENLEKKKEIIHTVTEEAYRLGMKPEDIVVDGLVATVGANKNAALETLETIRYCKQELGLATICGLSNISFGLPERIFVNTTFLSFAIREGLTMAISNPSQSLLVTAAFASDLLMNKEGADIRYIEYVTEHEIHIKGGQETKTGEKGNEENVQTLEGTGTQEPQLKELVIKGKRNQIIEAVKNELAKGLKPSELIDQMLIPGITAVGELFDQKKYFLPQLIASAETMKMAIDYLEPLLKTDSDGSEKGCVVMATVAGDIHDIGKNLVSLMLKNYGFRVLDLGKDVPTEEIIETARKEDADIIGLSALMTTTMMEMKQVVKRAKEEKLKAKIIIGGAVITQDFADEIGADGYSKDAQEAVQLVKRLLEM
ncbi:MAG: homocysteine S-methyltransferase family protein [Clostridiales bacterium]|nr:homocysteine S-methyltransferase family protein [Clostridiales bacterium]